MYGRKVMFDLKPNMIEDFKNRQEKEILPILKRQKGFQDVITLIEPNKKRIEAISLWEKREDAEAYERTGFQEETRVLAALTEGKPKVETLEVSTSTIHKAVR